MKEAIISIGLVLILVVCTTAFVANYIINNLEVISVSENEIRLSIMGEVNIYEYNK